MIFFASFYIKTFNLPVEIKREMLQNLSSQCFFKYYQEQTSKEDKLIKQLIKNRWILKVNAITLLVQLKI